MKSNYNVEWKFKISTYEGEIIFFFFLSSFHVKRVSDRTRNSVSVNKIKRCHLPMALLHARTNKPTLRFVFRQDRCAHR